MQRHDAGDQVEARLAERQKFGIGRDARRRRGSQKGGGRLGRDDLNSAGPHRHCPHQRAVPRAEIQDDREFAADQIEPVDQPIRDLGMQKIGPAPLTSRQARRAVAVQAPGAPVEQGGRGRIRGHFGEQPR